MTEFGAILELTSLLSECDLVPSKLMALIHENFQTSFHQYSLDQLCVLLSLTLKHSSQQSVCALIEDCIKVHVESQNTHKLTQTGLLALIEGLQNSHQHRGRLISQLKQILSIKQMYLAADKLLALNLLRVVSDFGIYGVSGLDDIIQGHLNQYTGEQLSYVIVASNVLSE